MSDFEGLEAPPKTKLTARLLDEMISQDLTREQIVALVKASLPREVKKRAKTDVEAEIIDQLASVLGNKLAAELTASLRRLQAPLTMSRAKGLLTEFGKTRAPVDAARMMIDRGWKGFYAKWYTDALRSSRGSSHRPKSALEEAEVLIFGDPHE